MKRIWHWIVTNNIAVGLFFLGMLAGIGICMACGSFSIDLPPLPFERYKMILTPAYGHPYMLDSFTGKVWIRNADETWVRDK